MRRATRNQHSTARSGLDFLIAPAYSQHAFEHIPCFVVMMMNVRRSDQERSACMPARVLPSAITNESPNFPRTCPASGDATIGEFIVAVI